MKKITGVIALMIQAAAVNAANYYGTALCAYPDYQCIKVGSGETWEKLFPNEQQRDVVQRLNRTYNSLWAGKVIAVPRNLAEKNLLDFSPFPLKINPEGEKQVIVDQDKLAWGAYDKEGQLVKWGPISSGRDRCPDAARSCRTMTGIFRFFSKENERCRSNVYPIGRGGAKMPFCMYFHKGFALHGSPDIPGYRASHGCVRMFTRDAEWLNHNFVDLSNDANHFLGTKVVIRPVLTKEEPQE
ncbi:enhanced entry protein EnhA [Legionella nautarum]|uniref:Enhanced entry protein EnhA n=1 Tax=Legionella nautarum TaxID=45070 RepID=A0A0W0WL23_9GAMM|nr:L,D-transpeptidase [Legionella nautarum]KTD32806.1 enhanced entry protein EnhA [Legionella nautarum]